MQPSFDRSFVVGPCKKLSELDTVLAKRSSAHAPPPAAEAFFLARTSAEARCLSLWSCRSSVFCCKGLSSSAEPLSCFLTGGTADSIGNRTPGINTLFENRSQERRAGKVYIVNHCSAFLGRGKVVIMWLCRCHQAQTQQPRAEPMTWTWSKSGRRAPRHHPLCRLMFV